MPNAAVLMPRGAELAAAAAVGAVAAALLLRRRREAVDSREAVDGLPRPGEPRPPVQADEATISRVLDVIERDVLPMTRERVPAGDKVFGAAPGGSATLRLRDAARHYAFTMHVLYALRGMIPA
mmetsp:Transcript_17952/g.56015  ORF Transcript_17952/g.56015 Transcript_17952/m.56015 type:complete len:124 (+) Transcript_17952:1419-1790(+)